jgi:hypothetical protein
VCAAALAGTACGVLSPEEQLLTDFFEAARVFDVSVMSRLSAVPLNPKTDGIVDSFEIVRVDRVRDGAEQVIVDARVRSFSGQVGSRQLIFTLTQRDGRWFIHEWRPAQGRPT